MTKKTLTTIPPAIPSTPAELTPAQEAATETLGLIQRASLRLAEQFVPLGDEERLEIPPVPNEFAEVAPGMIEALRLRPAFLGLFPEVDVDRSTDDLERVAALRPLAADLELLGRLVGDALRFHEGRAYTDLLRVYNVAKKRAEDDPTLRPVVTPLQKVYASRKGAKKNVG